jgi:hypothetical protein
MIISEGIHHFPEAIAHCGKALGAPASHSKERMQRYDRWKVCATSANPMPLQILAAETP